MDYSEKDFSKFKAVDDKLVAFFNFFAHISAIALIVIMLLAVVDVIGCKLAAAGVGWAHGISNNNAMIQYFHIPLVFLATACVTMDQGHTRIDLLSRKLPGKLEKVFVLFGHVIGVVASFFIAYRAVAVTLVDQLSKHTRIATTVTAWVAWPFTVCYILGFTLLGFSFVWSIVRTIKFWNYPGVNPYYIMHPEKAHSIGDMQEETNTTGKGEAEQ